MHAIHMLPKDLTVIGLTGGSGAGKSLVSECLAMHGIPTLDTDQTSREVTEVGSPCLAALAAHFGNEILLPDGSLDRRGLATLVFSAPDACGDAKIKKERLAALNAITHRYILEKCALWARARHEEGIPTVCMDAPQLFESGLDTACRYIFAVTADRELRLSRITARDGITREAAKARIASQHDDAFWHAHCTVVFENNSTPEALFARVDAVLHTYGLI